MKPGAEKNYSPARSTGVDSGVRLRDSQLPVLHPRALQGTAGDIVNSISPSTEAHPVALLTHLLTAFGSVVGDRPHFRVEHTRHPLRLFSILVGDTGAARKGQAWSTPRHLLSLVDPVWAKRCVAQGGLSSGEGLIYAVRDPLVERHPIRKRSGHKRYKRVIKDPGVSDKRLLVLQEEFSQVLRVMTREGNILSDLLRQAWDDGNLRTLTRNSPLQATNAHLGIIGHITKSELLRNLNDTNRTNGLSNRFIWILVPPRSKYIANPTGVPKHTIRRLVSMLRKAADFARNARHITRSRKAEKRWGRIYRDLSEPKPGFLGAIMGRAEAQVARISAIYALLDRSRTVKTRHLKAALALWRYAEGSIHYIFSDRLGDALADRILAELRKRRRMTLTDIQNLLQRHHSAREIRRALDLLEHHSLVTTRQKPTTGRPQTIWKLASPQRRRAGK